MTKARPSPVTALLIAALPALFCGCTRANDTAPDKASGGSIGIIEAADTTAFSKPLPALESGNRQDFGAGRRLFRVVWRPRSFSDATADTVGLGPLFNQRSCSGCHVRNGRGRPPDVGGTGPADGMIWRLSVMAGGKQAPHPLFGVQLQDQALPGHHTESRVTVSYRELLGTFADGTPYSLREPHYEAMDAAINQALWLSPRVPPAVFGGGLIEAVDVDVLRAAADPTDDDGDGISGRLAVVDGTDGSAIGRFGWKATRASLRDQVIEAAAEDLGLASPERPFGGCTPAQVAKIPDCAQPIELDDPAIIQLVTYLRGLAAPARRNAEDPTVRRGEVLFEQTGCTRCHRPNLATGDYPPLPDLGGKIIYPYTDLLLHDMGDGLADRAPDGAANGKEWRTPPLWGIGLVPTVNGHSFFLHDGRARSLMEAILWHGGEAAAARNIVVGLSEADRAALIAFIESL